MSIDENQAVMAVDLIVDEAVRSDLIKDPVEPIKPAPVINEEAPIAENLETEAPTEVTEEEFIPPVAENETDVVIELKGPSKPRIESVMLSRKPKPETKPKGEEKRATIPVKKESVVAKEMERNKIQAVLVSKPAQGFGFIKPVYPSYLRNPTPPYPKSAKRRKQEGTVLLFVRVDEKGRPTAVKVKKTSGVPVLDSSAIQTVKKWKFLPARNNNVAVSADVLVPIRFQLSKE